MLLKIKKYFLVLVGRFVYAFRVSLVLHSSQSVVTTMPRFCLIHFPQDKEFPVLKLLTVVPHSAFGYER